MVIQSDLSANVCMIVCVCFAQFDYNIKAETYKLELYGRLNK